jgi:hypothetical protein
MMVIAAAFSGCASPPEPTIYPPEPLPETLASLPRQAKIKCRNDPVLDRGEVYIWSLPGTYLADPDSGVYGERGDRIATMESCQLLQITDFYWDAYKAEYWVKIENIGFYRAPQEGQYWEKIETNDLVGWLLLRLVSTE